MQTFDDFGLSNPVLRALSELGFEKPSEIQQQAIPMLLSKETDLIGLAQTGTGKTAAFGVPLLERIDTKSRHTQALILAPTRELGQQIAQQLELYGKYIKGLSMLAVYGGASISQQINALYKPQHIIIATPGRLIDLAKRGAVDLEKIDYLILDEADEMLNMGFKEEIDEILQFTSPETLTWLFSATMPDSIRKIVADYMVDPVEVRVSKKNEVNKDIDHQYTIITRANKTEALTRFIDHEPEIRGVVFCRTKRETQNLSEELFKRNYKVDALHGDLSQPQRDRVMRRFKNGDLQVLIATDVAARGIDVNDLTHVFHFSLPDDGAYYTHRSGRTARAGKKGISIAFINGREKRRISDLQRELSIEFTKVPIPNIEHIEGKRIETWCHDVLNTRTKGRLSDEIIESINLLFGNLSKEELIAKFAIQELDKLRWGTTDDLNKDVDEDVPHYSSQSRKKNKKRYGKPGQGKNFMNGHHHTRPNKKKKRQSSN